MRIADLNPHVRTGPTYWDSFGSKNRRRVAALDRIDWSVRAKNAMARMGCRNISDLAMLPKELLKKGKCGLVTMRELIAGLVRLGITPLWLGEMRNYKLQASREVPDRYVLLAGPYTTGEREILELAVAQLATVAHVIVEGDDGYYIWRDPRGYKASPEDSEDE